MSATVKIERDEETIVPVLLQTMKDKDADIRGRLARRASVPRGGWLLAGGREQGDGAGEEGDPVAHT